jgi:hypothetical protein
VGHGGAPVSQYAKGFPSRGESAQSWSSTRSPLVALLPAQQDILVWMLGLGMEIPGAHVLGSGEIAALPTAGEVQAEMSKGLMLCDVVSLLEGVYLGTLNMRPKVVQEAMHNVNKALAVLRRSGRTSTQHLWSTSEVVAGETAAVWGLLTDIRSAYRDFPLERPKLWVAVHVDSRAVRRGLLGPGVSGAAGEVRFSSGGSRAQSALDPSFRPNLSNHSEPGRNSERGKQPGSFGSPNRWIGTRGGVRAVGGVDDEAVGRGGWEGMGGADGEVGPKL